MQLGRLDEVLRTVLHEPVSSIAQEHVIVLIRLKTATETTHVKVVECF